MNHIICAAKRAYQVGRLGKVCLDDLNIMLEGLDIYALSRREVIDDLYGLSPAQEFFDNVRPDKTGAPRYHIHCHR